MAGGVSRAVNSQGSTLIEIDLESRDFDSSLDYARIKLYAESLRADKLTLTAY